MKTYTPLKKSQIFEITFATTILYLFLTIMLVSCNDSKKEDSKDVAEEHNNAKFENAQEDDAKFLVSAAEITMEQIQLGQLAQNMGKASHVKDLGKMMETEHAKTLADLKTLASKKQITLPATLTDDGMSDNKKLTDTNPSSFDKEYADLMVSTHKDAISKFENASVDLKDADIRKWADSMVPTLRKHLDQSFTCQKECEKM